MKRQDSNTNKAMHSSSLKKFRTTFISNNNYNFAQKVLPSFQAYLKQYPIDIQEDIIQIVKMIQPLQSDFSQNLKSLKLYKQQLGSLFEDNWCDFLAYLKSIIIKMNKRTQKLVTQKQNKITQLLDTIKNIQLQKVQLQNKLQKIHNLRQLQNAQLIMANNQLDIVNREMRNIYKILQSDMSQVMKYLTTLQQKKQRQDQLISNQMNSSLNSLSNLLDSVQKQQVQTGSTLSTMKEMIKAMTKSTKVHTGTQVDQSQLQTNVGKIFTKNQQKIPLQVVQGNSINVNDLNQPLGVLQKMKQKQKQIPHQTYAPKKTIEKPWALTPALLVFLQNMSKQNQIGRVLPWEYVKQVINDVYEERIKYDSQISTSIIGNSMSFDQFVIFYFINKFKIRRLAEVKLLEMIISLKYYAKFWSKAEIFCCLLDVMRYQPLSDPNQSPLYKFDHYSQNYFFSIYKNIKKFNLYNDEDGTVYVETQNIRKMVKLALFFTDQLSKSRILVRLQKNLRIFNKLEYCDIDLTLILIIDEYFAVKKRNSFAITKSFSKIYQRNKGYFSIGEVYEVFDCLTPMYKKWEQTIQKYPIQSQLYLGKLYLFAITSGKNNYEMILTNFLNSVQKFGFDCPYPFIKNNSRKKTAKEQEKLNELKKNQKSEQKEQTNIKKNGFIQAKQVLLDDNTLSKSKNDIQDEKPTNQSLNTVRIDVASKLFSQHFSILKQLNDYVKIFAETLSSQKNPQTLWKSFNQIKVILQRGCNFLKYPLIKQKII